MDPVHTKRLNSITPGGSNAPPPARGPRNRPAPGSNTPPPSVHSLAAPSPSFFLLLHDHSAAASDCCTGVAEGRHEGHRRVPERPGARQGRHRHQGLGTCLPLLPSFSVPSRRRCLIPSEGIGSVGFSEVGWGLRSRVKARNLIVCGFVRRPRSRICRRPSMPGVSEFPLRLCSLALVC